MKKTYLLLIGWLLATSVFSTSTTDEVASLSRYDAPPRLPDLPMTIAGGTQINAQAVEGKVVLVLFQPDCDHCQREAEAIREYLDAFAEYTLYFITNAAMEDIQQFARDYQLSEEENIFFAFTELQSILDNFGSIPTPSLYIYSDQQQLVKAFEGETTIEEVLEYL